MGKGPVRINQLASTFASGSIVVNRDGTPLLVCGPDYWYRTEPRPMSDQGWATDIAEFQFTDWRLVEALQVSHFRKPPDYRPLRRGQTPAPNSNLHIATLRFPRWHYSALYGERGYRAMEYVSGEERRRPIVLLDKRRIKLLPVRFISICPEGHIDDFPWARWLGCPVEDDGQTPAVGHKLFYSEQGGDTLASIKVRCVCGKERSLAGALETGRDPDSGELWTRLTREINERMGDGAGWCRGRRPWIRQDEFSGPCGRPMAGAMLSGANVFFPRTQTSVYVPQAIGAEEGTINATLERALANFPEWTRVRLQWLQGQRQAVYGRLLYHLQESIQAFAVLDNDAQKRLVDNAMNAACENRPIRAAAALPEPLADSPEVSYRRVEYRALREGFDVKSEPDFRVLETGLPNLPGPQLFSRVRLIEKLRVTRAFLGFDRIEPGTRFGHEAAIHALGQLFRNPPQQDEDRWLPGIENRGEGIYIELDEQAIGEWLEQPSVVEMLQTRLSEPYLGRFNHQRFMPPLAGLAGDGARFWLARYLLVHGLAHTLINQFVFDSGYGSAALRERLFVSADQNAPMAAMLIYTAGDSEGSLGGLVRLGRPERLGPSIEQAIRRITWCSADPVCSEVDSQGPDGANKAACHACLLLPETACETGNRGLDRAMLVGTPIERRSGFFSTLAQAVLTG